ncbi:hypothetical protein [Halorubrum sp. SD683]|uniref:hypothetical protein n=1 Tax=Halorubrum sp. SD683 TaxID=1855873 RepID=UPI000A2E28ED|nr:hypothetical protein [Halorubrum sp. SD683]OTF00463.1 hypothetical protein B9G49_07425 [Halorubrum sp. SD683]
MRAALRSELLDRLYGRDDPAWDEWVAGLSAAERDELESLLDVYLRELDGRDADALAGLGRALGVHERARREIANGGYWDRTHALVWLALLRDAPERDPVRLGDGADASRELTGLRVTSDAAYLSVRIEADALGGGVDWDATNYLLAIGLTDRGERALPHGLGAAAPADFVVRLGGPDASRVTVRPRYDAFAYEYGAEAGLDLDRYREPDPGVFSPLRLVINRGYTVPKTGERVPFESVETGRLRYGNGNPDSDRYDSLADVHVSPSNDAIEVRLPWQLLNVADPSRRRRLGDFWSEGLDDYETFEAIDVAAASYVPVDADGTAAELDAETNLTHAVPGVPDGSLRPLRFEPPTWDRPAYTERLKESGRIVGDVFARYANGE